MIGTIAKDTIKREQHFVGTPTQIEYWISIEPRATAGFAQTGDGGPDFFGKGIAGNIAFVCAAETFATARIAVVYEAVLRADHHLITGCTLLIWRGDRWESGSDYELEILEKENPAVAKQIRRDMERMDLRMNEHHPATSPSGTK